jgi:ribosomal protein L7/L12
MVSENECSRCSFREQLGWFHVPIIEGFGSASLLMCSACGAQHMIRIALRPEFLEQVRNAGERYRVTLAAAGERPVDTMAALRRLLGCSLTEAKANVAAVPTTIGENLMKQDALQIQSTLERAGAQVTLAAISPAEPLQAPPQLQDELLVAVANDPRWDRLHVCGHRTGPAGEFELKVQRCGRCAKEGTLVSELPNGLQACPRCGAKEFGPVGGWTS